MSHTSEKGILRRLARYVGPRVLGTLTHVRTSEPLAALTFDDGPHPDSTPRLLDVLEKHGARATFFMLGKSAELYPEIVKRAGEAGHALGVHGWDHASFPLLSGRERREQIRACARVLGAHGRRLLRPPYGHQSFASRLDALLLGYRVVAWNIAAWDWLDREAVWMADFVAERLLPGCIVCLHDVLYHTIQPRYADRGPVIAAVDRLLDRFSGNYRFVTVPELLRNGQALKANWYKPPDVRWLNGLQGQFGEPRRYAG